ncbi:MAG: PhzF family phenazine biosynthesis protein [Planctomycetota bacterium]
MPLPLSVVNAFATRLGAGNPAGVCRLPGLAWPDAEWMRQVAAELKHSETAFVLSPEVGDDASPPIRPIRYFTPEIEVELCGHATLAAAHTLWRDGQTSPDQPIRFRTIADQVLTCTRDADGLIRMDLPASPPVPPEDTPENTSRTPAGLAEVLGEPLLDLQRAGPQWLGVWPDAGMVCDWSPDHAGLAALDWGDAHGLVLTAVGGALPDGRPADFTSRFFAPGAGVAEDPVTGSAHAALGPYWAERLGKTKLLAHQASRRGGTLAVEVLGDRVVVAGHAVTTVAGQWVGPPS